MLMIASRVLSGLRWAPRPRRISMSQLKSPTAQKRTALRAWGTAGIIVAVIVLAAFMSMRSDAVPVRTAVATRQVIRSEITTNGKVEPIANFEAHAPISTTGPLRMSSKVVELSPRM